jgi:hypothetical protein
MMSYNGEGLIAGKIPKRYRSADPRVGHKFVLSHVLALPTRGENDVGNP